MERRAHLFGVGVALGYEGLFSLLIASVSPSVLPPIGWLALHVLTEICFFICPFIALRLAGRSLRQAGHELGFQPITRADLLVTLVCGMALLLLQSTYFALLSRFGVSMSFGYPESSQVVVPFVGLAVLIAPLSEEVFFRGYLAIVIRHRVWYVLGSSCLWAALHLDPASFVPLCVTGMIYCWLRLRTRSLVPGLLLHISLNTLALLAFLLVGR